MMFASYQGTNVSKVTYTNHISSSDCSVTCAQGTRINYVQEEPRRERVEWVIVHKKPYDPEDKPPKPKWSYPFNFFEPDVREHVRYTVNDVPRFYCRWAARALRRE